LHSFFFCISLPLSFGLVTIFGSFTKVCSLLPTGRGAAFTAPACPLRRLPRRPRRPAVFATGWLYYPSSVLTFEDGVFAWLCFLSFQCFRVLIITFFDLAKSLFCRSCSLILSGELFSSGRFLLRACDAFGVVFEAACGISSARASHVRGCDRCSPTSPNSSTLNPLNLQSLSR